MDTEMENERRIYDKNGNIIIRDPELLKPYRKPKKKRVKN